MNDKNDVAGMGVVGIALVAFALYCLYAFHGVAGTSVVREMPASRERAAADAAHAHAVRRQREYCDGLPSRIWTVVRLWDGATSETRLWRANLLRAIGSRSDCGLPDAYTMLPRRCPEGDDVCVLTRAQVYAARLAHGEGRAHLEAAMCSDSDVRFGRAEQMLAAEPDRGAEALVGMTFTACVPEPDRSRDSDRCFMRRDYACLAGLAAKWRSAAGTAL